MALNCLPDYGQGTIKYWNYEEIRKRLILNKEDILRYRVNMEDVIWSGQFSLFNLYRVQERLLDFLISFPQKKRGKATRYSIAISMESIQSNYIH